MEINTIKENDILRDKSKQYLEEKLSQTSLVRNRTLQENWERRYVPKPHARIEQIEQNHAVFHKFVENAHSQITAGWSDGVLFFCAFCGMDARGK